MSRRRLLPSLVALAACFVVSFPASAQQPVVSSAAATTLHFESGPTRPLLLSPGGAELYVLNTADHRVEIYSTVVGAGPSGPWQGLQASQGLTYTGAVFTGLEPVSMALHPDDPSVLFVANHLSDSLAVVDLDARRVVATVPVGDEPSDVVVADGQVVVSCSRAPTVRDLIEPSGWVENAVVFVDAAPPYAVLDQVGIAGHRPRALAVDDGVVHVVPLNSGNHTTVLSVTDQESLGMDQTTVDAFDPAFEINPGLLAPGLSTQAFTNTSFGLNLPGWAIPRTARIVNDSEFPGHVVQLADEDLHRIALADHGVLPGAVTGVGTTLLAIGRHPTTGTLWVPNTDARNRTRFEPSIQGAAIDNRVTRVDPTGGVLDVLHLAPPLTTREHAQPVAVEFLAGDGVDLAFVAALGTDTVVVLDGVTGQLVAELDVGPLPLGLEVDVARRVLYVFTLGDKTVRAYDVDAQFAPARRARPLAYDPEPRGVVEGRRHLYDAKASSGAGTDNFSCASCHVFGHLDALAWDLGDPGGGMGYFFPDLMTGEVSFDGQKVANKKAMMTHPMKGPMVTQSLRGLGDEKGPPLHWRGDRRFFQMFRGAFVGLLGGPGISKLSMQQYATFTRGLVFPPNPYQRRDRGYTGAAALGADVYGMNAQLSGKTYNPFLPGVSCIDCHEGNFADGSDFTGAQRTVNFDGPDQLFNSATLRGVYEKEFMHLTGYGTSHDGDQVGTRGFLDSDMGGIEAFSNLTNAEKDQVTEFVRAWDSGLSPLVGVQHTTALDAPQLLAWLAYLDLAEEQARPPAGHVDLIGKLHVALGGGATLPVGVLYALDPSDGQWRWRTDGDRWVDRALIEQLVFAGLVQGSFTAVPPGWGLRLGLDRDEDGLLDGEERALGSRPHDPDSDDDGYADAHDLALGGHPLIADAFLAGDVTAPGFSLVEARDVFVDVATLHVVLDEPGSVSVDAGLFPGDASLGSVSADELRRVHDLHVAGLPAGTEVFFRLTSADRNGNSATHDGSFTTTPPMFHVADMQLTSDGADPLTITCRVTVVDQAGVPVPDFPVKLMWAGDIGGQEFFPPVERTDASGVSTHLLEPFSPAGPGTVTATIAFLGSNVTDDPFFIGLGGDDPTFFYDQISNAANWVSLELP